MKRKAQGAIEYLFMIAAALVVILIVVRQLRGKGSQAGQTADLAAKQSEVELIVQKYNSTDWWSQWSDEYTQCMDDGNATACDQIIENNP